MPIGCSYCGSPNIRRSGAAANVFRCDDCREDFVREPF